MRRIDPTAKVFACFDAISGYHQLPIDEESKDLLCIITQICTFRCHVLGQGVCSFSDFFNLTTDGTTKLDENFKCLKNMDNFLLFGSTMEELEVQIENALLQMDKLKTVTTQV